MPDLEERVAALEELVRFPLKYVNSPPMSDEDVAKFRGEFEASLGQPCRILPSVPLLTPEQIRYLLRECVTVVKPGETLVVQVPMDTPPRTVLEIQRTMDEIREYRDLGCGVLIVPGDNLGAMLEPEFMAATRMEPVDGDVLTVRLTHEPTGVTIMARDRTEGVYKLRKALAAHARRQYDLQEQQRRQEREAAKEAPGAA